MHLMRLFTDRHSVGHYKPDGQWEELFRFSITDQGRENALRCVNRLNGGMGMGMADVDYIVGRAIKAMQQEETVHG